MDNDDPPPCGRGTTVLNPSLFGFDTDADSWEEREYAYNGHHRSTTMT